MKSKAENTSDKKLERARVTLNVICTWAKFYDDLRVFNRVDVLRLVEKTLRETK